MEPGSTTDRVVSRGLWTLAAANAIGGVGLAAGGTAGPILAAEVAGSEAVAGLPIATLVVGSALSALAISRRTSRVGRASGLAMGFAAGAFGAAVVIVGAVVESLAVVLVGTFLLGGANAAIFLARYAAAELAGPGARGRGLGTVLFATTIGAVASPNLLGPSGDVAEILGLPELAGLFLVAGPAFAIAGLLVGGLSRAGARVRRELATGRPPPGPGDGATSVVAMGLRAPSARVALLVLATSNLVMVAIMSVAPLHLIAHGHGLGSVGLVVSLHVAGMFAPSPVTGRIVDRIGAGPVAAAGMVLLTAVGLTSVVLDLGRGPTMTVFLLVVGLAWNVGVVGASALLASSVSDEARPHTEGIGEVAMGLAAAAGAPGAGLAVAFGGFATLGVAGAVAAALTFVALALGSRPSATRV